ncbi:MAG: VanZ family protein [Mariprofundales bacterium]
MPSSVLINKNNNKWSPLLPAYRDITVLLVWSGFLFILSSQQIAPNILNGDDDVYIIIALIILAVPTLSNVAITRALALLFGWCILLFLLSHQSTLPKPPIDFAYLDKVEHAIAYGIMAWLAWRVCILFSWSALAAIIWCSLYGISDEIHQSFIVGRAASVEDWLADTLGAVVVIVFLYCYEKTKNPNE